MKNTTGLFRVSLAAAVIAVAGCAAQPKLTHEQILSQYQQVDSLETALQQARSKNAELLAPESYDKASDSLSYAIKAARSNNTETAKSAATEGLKTIDKLKRDAQNSREILAEVLLARDRAHAAGAKTMQSENIAELDEDLKKTSALIEKGNVEQAKQRRPKLIADYSQLELIALKQGIVDQAKSAITNAKKQGAEKYAPQTLTQAEDEMALAMSILDADRTQTDKANLHAKKTKWLAEKSAVIAETVKDFDRRDYSMEDVVLWHQQQLKTVNQPLGGQLPFNQASDKVVLDLRNAVAKLVDDLNVTNSQMKQATEAHAQSQIKLKAADEKISELMTANQSEMLKLRGQYEMQLATTQTETAKQSQLKLKAADEKIAALTSAKQGEIERLRAEHEKQLAIKQQERLALEQKERMEQQKFETVQAMFDSNEANVYRQRQNILISAHGFQFPSGQSEIHADNFPLMNKIVRAIKTFKNARVEVNGHTDSTGNDNINQSLSEARAEKVAKFLNEVGEINTDKITALGFGESRPVATNDTVAGRAENRRVEIKIVNE